MDEVILIDKPDGITSFGVVARVRRVLKERVGSKVKVGHTGTLDPFATGLLILLAGKATKRSNEFLKKDKEYEAEIFLGSTSTTGDPEGEISQVSDKVPSLEEIESVCSEFVGEISQKVPAFSAVKINGQRAYQLARSGKEVDTPTRKVTIYSIEILSYNYPVLKIKTFVSSGTYIRTLGEDIGAELKTGAYLTALRRTKIGDYSVSDAVKLDDFMNS
ncbi:tRNA pseudouridine(55) synthase TruB [Candidatus Saccharibacteria bacterium]|nr:tRNA pseudouridine(55) synthase TruB [Candidatus Saccharibacteria bacterium]